MRNVFLIGLRTLCRLATIIQAALFLSACAALDQSGVRSLDTTIASTPWDFTSGLSHDALDGSSLPSSASPGAFGATSQSKIEDTSELLELIEAQLARGNDEGATRLLSRLSAQVPEYAIGRVYQAHGVIALRAGQLDRARDLLERSVDADGSLWRAWIRLGRLHLLAGRTSDAQVAFVLAEQIAPRTASAQNDIGMGHLKLEKPGVAIQYFERALRIDPSHSLAKANLTIAKAMSGEYKAALHGIPASRQQDALNNVGYAAFLRGDHAQADTYLRRAVAADSDNRRTASANLNLIVK